jgi:hypothetical protein
MWTRLSLRHGTFVSSEPLRHTGISGFSYLLAKCSEDTTLGGSFSFVKAVEWFGVFPLSKLFFGTICMSTRWANITVHTNRRAKGARRHQDKVLPLCFAVRETYRKVQSFSWECAMEYLYGSLEGRCSEAVCRPVRVLEIRIGCELFWMPKRR